MSQNSKLTFECLAIGSLPHDNLEKAMELVKKDFYEIPFWPQLTNINKNEDMIIQFLEKMPSFFVDKNYLDTECDKFFEDIEEFFNDYEIITSQNLNETTAKILDKYAISKNNSMAFPKFIEIIKETKPNFAKGQIVGPFTLSTSLADKSGKSAFYDETLREIITKTLILKALWQIKEIKCANSNTVPIIFIDEPSLSQLGTSAFLTISQKEVVEMLKSVSDIIKQYGAISAIHCCGKCDWSILIDAGVDIINTDAYNYAQNLSVFSGKIKTFLENGGKIAWGVVPTLDAKALENMDLNKLKSVFEKAVKYLTKKGINEKIILENSIITPSCGAGGLSEELAEKAMDLTRELAEEAWHSN